jgi:hypothetical protein
MNKTYLLNWNPEAWEWGDVDNAVNVIKSTGCYIRRWSCGNISKNPISVGDDIYLIKLGTDTNGIIGRGICVCPTYIGKHWSGYGQANYIDIAFHEISPITPIISISELPLGVNWQNQSAQRIYDEAIVDQLHTMWLNKIL